MFEIDFELVALDRGDGAVAKLSVEHALAKRQVVAALVAERNGGRAGFDHALRLGVVVDPARALPSRPARWPRDVGERVRPLRPLRAPQAFAAGHRGFLVDVRLGKLGKEARGN